MFSRIRLKSGSKKAFASLIRLRHSLTVCSSTGADVGENRPAGDRGAKRIVLSGLVHLVSKHPKTLIAGCRSRGIMRG